MSQITLRGVPARLERRLRQLSARKSKSLNAAVLEALEKGLGMKGDSNRARDLSGYAGTWTQAEHDEFARNSQVFEQIDPEVWK